MITLELYIDNGEGWELYRPYYIVGNPCQSDIQVRAAKFYQRYRYSIGNRPWLILQVPQKKKGRPKLPEDVRESIISLYSRRKSASEVAKLTGVSRPTVQKVVKDAA